jgi:murein DD-endopeptidase MepM/ murein hydrolase activator NlpD
LFGLGVRADIETGIRFQENRVLKLEGLVKGKTYQIKELHRQLQPPEYSQPVDQIVISSITGIRVNPMGGGTESLHKGIDLSGKKGTPIKALLSGRVVGHWLPPGWYGDRYFHGHSAYGGYIVLDHGNQLFSTYGHLSKTFVHEDDWIEIGQKIGEMGSTGISTGTHLHFEIVANPFRYLEERKRR